MTSELQTQKQEVEVTEGVERTRAARVYKPAVDIYSTDGQIVIVADVPGVGPGDIDIALEKNILTIRGFVSEGPVAPEGYEVVHAEYGVGDFERSFTLPDEIDRDNIEAHLDNGVLRLELPLAPEAQTRRIEVKTG